jgi:hypothetical protein
MAINRKPEGEGQASSTFTDAEATFIRAWRRLWPVPRDWSARDIFEGVSGFLDWREWLSHLEPAQIDLLCQLLPRMATGATDDRGPTQRVAAAVYRRATGRSSNDPPRGPGTERCPDCAGTGFVPLILVGHKVLARGQRPEPGPRGPYLATSPCRCHRGHSHRGTTPDHAWVHRRKWESVDRELGDLMGQPAPAGDGDAAGSVIGEDVAAWAASSARKQAPPDEEF